MEGTRGVGQGRSARAVGAVVAGVVIGAAALVAAPTAGATGSTRAAGAAPPATWVANKVCGAPAPGTKSCFAERLESNGGPVAPRTGKAGSGRATQAGPAGGPAGGYTPAEVAKAYGVDVNASAASTQTVAIVDAYDDPTVKTDLAAFDSHYGIPAETSSSFQVVNQLGATSPLPAANTGWAGEITLDVQAVRGLCRKCKILLVEADSNSDANLAAAVNRAAAMHATEISNSYGGNENDSGETPAVTAAYDHPGIVITASTGDDGWYGYDAVFDSSSSDGVSQVPASLPTVVGVSGTSLYLNADSTRASETVWNENGPKSSDASLAGRSRGAAGGGCSATYAAQGWQAHVSGYAALGCATAKRSSTDIAALADPYTGYDLYQTYGASPAGWQTYGGTSLSSPVVAALWALAGGSGGVPYPSLSLYGHYQHDTSRPFADVTVGGTGMCNTSSKTSCARYWNGNPNTLGGGLTDCAFAATGTATLTNVGQCYAEVGFDGVSGVGTPKGLTGFTAMAPTAAISKPTTAVTHGVSRTYSGAGSTDPFPGGTITAWSWNWGDGHTSTGVRPTHTYTSAASKRTITLTVTDNYGRKSVAASLAIVVH